MLSDSSPPTGSTVTSQANALGRWLTRIGLFLFHITLLVATIFLAPEGYAFQLGEYTGPALVSSSVILWSLLLSSKTKRAFTIFCLLVLVQAGFVALVALHFRAEDRALRPIFEEIANKRKRWESEMVQFRMDSLFEMISGKRTLSIAELKELHARAQAGKAKIGEVQSEVTRDVTDAERRIGGVSSGAARDFRRGFESTRPATEEQMKLMQEYFTATDQLTDFLIHRQGQYSQTSDGLVFTRDADAEAFNKQLDAITHLQKQIDSVRSDYTQNRDKGQ